MKVTLIDYTKNAINKIVFARRTRLKMTADAWHEVEGMSNAEKMKEVNHALNTIKSGFEFVDYDFLIEGVTRAFTHQLVRHRVGVSFAQQAQRVVDASDFEYLATGLCRDNSLYSTTMSTIRANYQTLVEDGVHPQDARGILPTNVLTNILMKINLRSLASMMEVRLCKKAQGEYQQVALELRNKALEVHPWAFPLLQVWCVKYADCQFPDFKECPVRPYVPDRTMDKEDIYSVWESTSFEAQSKEIK